MKIVAKMKQNFTLVFIFLLGIFLINSALAIDIKDCNGLQDINKDLSGDYVLTGDIDCSDTINWNGGAGFLPIGPSYSPFGGILDGNGHTISNLYIRRQYAGMFDTLTDRAVLKNIRLSNAAVYIEDPNGWGEGGLLVYWAGGSRYDNILIDNISAEGSVYGGGAEWSGGLLGYINKGVTVSNCQFTGHVEAAGGLVGQNDGVVINSSFSGDVDGTKMPIDYAGPAGDYKPGLTGGFVGWNFGTISSSYSEGTVTGQNNVGGFVGGDEYVDDNWRGEIFNSYSTSEVTAADYKGGFVGYNVGGDIINSFSTGAVKDSVVVADSGLLLFDAITLAQSSNYNNTGGFLAYNGNYECYDSFWDIDTSGVNESACSVNGKSTDEMKDSSTYDTWDSNVWLIQDGKYPCFKWDGNCADSDNDGVSDNKDKCPDTPETEEQIVYGCSCNQILELKPGDNIRESIYGCSDGTIETFTKGKGWAKDLF